MKALVIFGNTRSKSNTKALAEVFADALSAKGVEVTKVSLIDKTVQTCVGCDKCHTVTESYGCVINDDMQNIADQILQSDLVVLSSPIYSWMPTPPLKAVMDRLYACTKYPESGDMYSLMKKQKFAMIATSADECETNCDLFDEAVRRLAGFSKLPYLGYLAAQDKGDGNILRQDVIDEARVFAGKCADALAAG